MIGVFINNHNDACLKVNEFFQEAKQIAQKTGTVQLFIEPDEKKRARCSIYFSHESASDTGFQINKQIQRLKERIRMSEVPDRPYVFVRYSSQPLTDPLEYIPYGGRHIYKLYARNFIGWKNAIWIQQGHKAFIDLCMALDDGCALSYLLGEQSLLNEEDEAIVRKVKILEAMFGSPCEEVNRSLNIIFHAILTKHSFPSDWTKNAWWQNLFKDNLGDLRLMLFRFQKGTFLHDFIMNILSGTPDTRVGKDMIGQMVEEQKKGC